MAFLLFTFANIIVLYLQKYSIIKILLQSMPDFLTFEKVSSKPSAAAHAWQHGDMARSVVKSAERT